MNGHKWGGLRNQVLRCLETSHLLMNCGTVQQYRGAHNATETFLRPLFYDLYRIWACCIGMGEGQIAHL